MKVGAEPKKVAILAALLALAGYLLISNFLSDSPSPAASPVSSAPGALPAPRVAQDTAAPRAAQPAGRPPRSASQASGTQEFKPSMKPKVPVDPMSVDPTLRLDLLAKLREIKLEGGERSLFEFSQPRPPKTPDPKIVPKTAAVGPKPPEPAAAKPAEPAKPPPPPIPLKFYGYITSPQQGNKRAFFLEGEEIFVASEGELIRRRYKVVRIGVNSVVVEDVEHKHQQTLPLEEQAG